MRFATLAIYILHLSLVCIFVFLFFLAFCRVDVHGKENSGLLEKVTTLLFDFLYFASLQCVFLVPVLCVYSGLMYTGKTQQVYLRR